MAFCGDKTAKHAKRNCLKWLKIALPHIGLTITILVILLVGATIFQALEKEKDQQILEVKAIHILDLYEAIASNVTAVCRESGGKTKAGWKKILYDELGHLSSFHEQSHFHIDADNVPPAKRLMRPRWNYVEAVLYALSILTTTGYTYVVPMTTAGRIFAIVYGLIGIPLMVLTAVDIGRFLSDCVLFIYQKITQCISAIIRCLGCLWSTRSVEDVVETRSISPKIALKPVGSKRGRPAKLLKQKRKLPLLVNATILLLFCMLGAVSYLSFDDGDRTFMEAFFIAFNLVANLTMSEMPASSTLLTVVYIVFFVTFGLAVLSMCADLAASELKWLFMKIHYFGRKIGRKSRREAQALALGLGLELDVEVAELLKIIDGIRAKYPDKEKIEAQDIIEFIQEMGQRRDTIAFQPEYYQSLKFADEFEEGVPKISTVVIRNPTTDSDDGSDERPGSSPEFL